MNLKFLVSAWRGRAQIPSTLRYLQSSANVLNCLRVPDSTRDGPIRKDLPNKVSYNQLKVSRLQERDGTEFNIINNTNHS
jgi:hypothetical protein